MTAYQRFIDNNGVIGVVQRTLDHIDARLVEHGTRVAYMVYRMLLKKSQWDLEHLRNICFVTMLHDIGAYKIEEIDKLVQFETGDVWGHSIYGYLFLKYFSFLKELAPVILFHHTDWKQLQGYDTVPQDQKYIAQLIHIADRADIIVNRLGRSKETLIKTIKEHNQFAPEVIDLFLRTMPEFPMETQMQSDVDFWKLVFKTPFTPEQIAQSLRMIVYSIDFRSPHTVTHTMTTIIISKEIARYLGLSQEEIEEIACGAMLHDIGKIGVPVSILENPGKLNACDMAVMRTHVQLTDAILRNSVPDKIRDIALRHHEKLDGSGYPLGLHASELTMQQRIVAVADIVSALHGTRSYKDAFPKGKTISIISMERDRGHIDSQVVNVVIQNYDEIMCVVEDTCAPLLELYHTVNKEYNALKKVLDTNHVITYLPVL